MGRLAKDKPLSFDAFLIAWKVIAGIPVDESESNLKGSNKFFAKGCTGLGCEL